MPFPVVKRIDLSLDALCAIDRAGGSVVKSPHVGNIYPNNLAVAKAGLRMVFYDRTIGKLDRNFHPHGVIRKGRFEYLTAGHIMTTHTRVERESSLAPEWFHPGERLVDGHMRAMRAAIPETQGVVYTDYLAERAGRITEALEVLTDARPDYWERFLGEDGKTIPLHVSSWSGLARRGVFGITSADSGALIPNTFNILLISVMEAIERRVPEVYHLSGPDMVRYINGMVDDLHALYDVLRARLPDWQLPETLPLNLVAVPDMRFAVLANRRPLLDELIDAYLALQSNNRVYGERLRTGDGDRKTLIAEIASQRQRDLQRLTDAVHSCPDVFYQIEQANSVTQYDVLDEPGGVYVHPWGLSASMKEVSLAMRTFERLI